ncbi:MAG TPA: hypothetical protein VKV40_19245 [Ktedonobacteraceae bacterium]|nr:hypothetical protein [Ktedonobacteraceae bacterium]
MAVQSAGYLQALQAANAEAQLSSFGYARIVSIRATVSALEYPMLPFAILKGDPRLDFQQWVEIYLPEVEGQESALRALCEAWNRPFVLLDPEQLFFVCAWSSVPQAPALVVQTSELIFGIATSGPYQKRWCTTRAVTRQGELVAWCCEIDMGEEACKQMARVVFSEENMIRLAERQ